MTSEKLFVLMKRRWTLKMKSLVWVKEQKKISKSNGTAEFRESR